MLIFETAGSTASLNCRRISLGPVATVAPAAGTEFFKCEWAIAALWIKTVSPAATEAATAPLSMVNTPLDRANAGGGEFRYLPRLTLLSFCVTALTHV
jgi:hypothetical protein